MIESVDFRLMLRTGLEWRKGQDPSVNGTEDFGCWAAPKVVAQQNAGGPSHCWEEPPSYYKLVEPFSQQLPCQRPIAEKLVREKLANHGINYRPGPRPWGNWPRISLCGLATE